MAGFPEYCPQCGVPNESNQHHCPPHPGSFDSSEVCDLQTLIKRKAKIGFENGRFFFYYPGYYAICEDDGTMHSNREEWHRALKRYIGTSYEEALKFIQEYQL